MEERYGISNATKSEIFKEKIKKTNLLKYNALVPSQSTEVLQKMKNTCVLRYGVPNPMKPPEIKIKANKTLYKNGSQKSSKQQRYLCNIYNGELNYPIKYYGADICLPTEKLIVEYDGSGHDLNVKRGNMTQEEFNQKEIIRSNIIKREGYKQIRIISRKDLLPSDNILLQMLEIAREYFSTTFHTWINFDVDNSLIVNAKNKDIDGIFFDYGNLRKIK